jgi:hypothetical protein
MNVAISSRTPQQALAALLDRYAPARLLLIGASEFPALSAFKEAHPDTVVAHAAPGAHCPPNWQRSVSIWRWWSIAWNICPSAMA